MYGLSSQSDNHPSAGRRLATVWIHASLIAAAFVTLAWSTWLTWPDAIVDFGRELYVPWQILEGKVLYRDIALFNGPFSPYFNGLGMALFGVSLQTLVILNLAISVLVLTLLYRLVAATVDPTAALFAGLTFVALFVFNQYIVVGNYNWIAPYSHEMTHGIALALLALFWLKRFLECGSARSALLTGICLGLVLLTKVEIGLAAGVAVVGGFVLGIISTRAQGHNPVKLIACFALGTSFPAFAAISLLALAMPLKTALIGTLGSFFYLFHSQHSTLPFFAAGTGFLNPIESVASQLRWLLAYGLVFISLGALALSWTRGKRLRRIVAAMCCLEVLLALWFSLPHFRQFEGAPRGFALLAGLTSAVHLKQFARPWPLILVGLLLLIAFRLHKNWKQGRQLANQVFTLCAIVFALLLLMKMVLNARIGHYGFGLAMPAAVILVAALSGTVSQWISTKGGNGLVFRRAFLTIWLIIVVLHLGVSTVRLSRKTVRVAKGPDTFLADARGHVINEVLDRAQQEIAPDQTLAVLPDGEMLNYLARRTNPSRFGNFIPATVVLFGEEAMLENLQSATPDFVALVHKDTSEYGPRFFGRDYALRIHRWITENYKPIHLAGMQPFQDDTQFGVLLLRHRELSKQP
jgi:hypothetical protein